MALEATMWRRHNTCMFHFAKVSLFSDVSEEKIRTEKQENK
jgi:hypothetical protein